MFKFLVDLYLTEIVLKFLIFFFALATNLFQFQSFQCIFI